VFGKIKRSKLSNLFLFLKGSLVISAPLYFHAYETIQIFEILDVKLNQYNSSLIIILIYLSLISNFFINKNILLSLLDSFTIIILNINFEPLLDFTIYYCFLHSIRHSLSLIQDTNNRNLKKGLINFLKKALPLTIITAFGFLIAVFLLYEYYLLDSAILKVVFIGLASLTFPHILLEYLLEKNEK
jgi:Brp/Blh family beta-carotene 15,15'-monooxygenase